MDAPKTALLLRQWGAESIWRALAALVLLVAATTIPAGAGGRHMVGFEIRMAFDGITLDGIYYDGLFFTETYFEDGSIRYHDTEGSDSGEWIVEDDTFCTFYESLNGACFFVEREGDNCFTFFEAIADADGRLRPAEEWTSRGWDRAKDSTCITAPTAEI
ncbi:hypothetical protein [Bauldia sp.]|uniref:hypothetical protein n=1 Tax=Bauldia sp. TaxID=2575872 RepID=UPI003BAB8592